MYFLIITYPGSGTQVLMHLPAKDDNRAIAADETNKDLLISMGEQLLNENVISSYQLVQTVGDEVNQINRLRWDKQHIFRLTVK